MFYFLGFLKHTLVFVFNIELSSQMILFLLRMFFWGGGLSLFLESKLGYFLGFKILGLHQINVFDIPKRLSERDEYVCRAS